MFLKKLFLFSLCGFLFSASLSLPASAAGDDPTQEAVTEAISAEGAATTETSAPGPVDCTYFVDVKTDIALADDDVFFVTIASAAGTESMIEINGKEAQEKSYTLPEGTYTISSIEYGGVNPAVTQGGYGVTKTFTVSSGTINRLSLCVGSAQLAMAGDTVLSVTQPYTESPESTVTGTTASTDTNTNMEETAPAESMTQEETTTTNDPPEEDVVEYPEETTEEEETENEPKGILYYAQKFLFGLVVAAIVGIGTIIFYVKKGRN